MKKKITAIEVNPEHIDFSFYFEDDGLTNIGGENCAVYIIPPDRRHYRGFNMDEYERIEEQAEAIIEGFDDIKNGYKDYYNSYKEVMENNEIIYNSRKCSLLKKWSENANINDTECIAEFLTIITGEEWSVKSFTGYSQGDYCEIMYCEKHYSKEHLIEIGKFWLGCGTEFCIDDCYGYYVTDDIRWTEDGRLVKHLADLYGCKPEELEVHLYKGEHKVVDYELLAI